MFQRRHARGVLGRKKKSSRDRTANKLKMERLEARQLLAFNIVDDSFSLASDTSLNVLGNDTLGTETQAVSAMNVQFDRDTVRSPNPDTGAARNNFAENFVPADRSDGSGLPQRSVYAGAMTLLPTQNNYADVDIYTDNDADPTNDAPGGITRFNRQDGIVLGTLMSNEALNEEPIPQLNGPEIAVRSNLAVVQFTSGSPTLPNVNPGTWIATDAAPENDGERAVDFSAAMFRFDDGWVGATFNGETRLAGSEDVAVTGSEGQYELTVAGVTDSFSDGYLFVIGGENDNTYARALPAGGDRWSVVLRTNSQGFSESEIRGGRQRFSALYIPRSASGLIGGTVRGGTDLANPMAHSSGDFQIQRVEDGLWRLTVPGQDATTGMVLLESADASPTRPPNAYFSYDVDPDDANAILIRQFNYEAPEAVPSNDDFTFFFVPFENNLLADRPGLTITRLGADAGSLVTPAENPQSAAGISLAINADGTIDYQTAGAIRALPEGATATDSFVYEVQFVDGDGNQQTETATVSIVWTGVNDRPDVIGDVEPISRGVGQPAFTLDLDTIFEDVDTGDSLTFSVDVADAAIAAASVTGSELSVIGLSAGSTELTITATDQGGLSRSVITTASVTSLSVLDDVFSITDDTVLSPLNNDRVGTEVQNVSAMNVVYDRDPATGLSRTANFAINTVPDVPGQPGVPQRSVYVGAMTLRPNENNYGDVALFFDLDDDPSNDTGNIARINKANGIALGTMMDNSPLGPGQHGPDIFAANSNLAVVQYTSNDAGESWIATNAAPENNGERAIDFSTAFFPYNAGWVGGSFNFPGNNTSANRASISWGGAGLTVTEVATGQYEVEVDGVTDSFNDGFLFAIGGDNSDNYTRTRPLGGNKWSVWHRDNAHSLFQSEGNSWNVLYIPRSAPGLIGGVVNGSSDVVNPMKQSFGDFQIRREEDGFWRLSVPGHSPTSGVLIMETLDLSIDIPRNSYFSYVAADDNPDDFIIRQFDYTRNPSTLNPQNGDFAFFFIPFENDIQSGTPIEITRVGSSVDTLGDNQTAKGIEITVNPDGTINYSTDGAIRALGEGQTDVDTFVYEASFGGETQTATVTINWVGANDPPELVQPLGEIDLLEDGSTAINLGDFFSDPDIGDSLSYSVSLNRDDVVDVSFDGDVMTIAGQPDRFGFVRATLTATDQFGASLAVDLPISVFAQPDGPIAVDDAAVGLKNAVLTLDLLANDSHPDAGPYQVVGANIFGNAEATNDAETEWMIEQTGSGANVMTMIGAQNRGDLAIGVNGEPATPRDGVLLGTIRNDEMPFGSVNVWPWAARGDALTFATELGAGGNGERNAPLGAALFPFAEGWIGGHVATDGTLVHGNGVNQSNVEKIQTEFGSTGLWTVSIPGVTDSRSDGFLLVIGGNNDDNFVNALPLGGDSWLIRQMDNDSDEFGFENDPFSFVYVPLDTPGLIAGRWVAGTPGEDEEDPGTAGAIDLSAGTFTAADSGFSSVIINIPGVTPQDGALIVMPAGAQDVSLPDGSTVQIPPNLHGFYREATDNAGVPTGGFEVELRRSNDFFKVAAPLKFMYIPFANPLRTSLSADSVLTVQSVDAVSSSGAAVSINPGDGTVAYDPTGSATIAALNPGESLVDTFDYTVVDGAGRTATATASVTVFGTNSPTEIGLSENQVVENTDTSTASLLVGTLFTELVVEDVAETFVYELFEGDGGTDNASFEIVDDQLFVKQGTDIDFETQPEYLVRVRVTTASGETLVRDLTVGVVDLLEVAAVVVNDGADQRSRVGSVSVEFDGEAVIGEDAFEVIKLGDGGGAVDFAVTTATVDGRTVATLAFAGDFTEFGSLVDGNYQLRVDGAKVARPGGELLDADKNGSGGGELLFGDQATDNFFRLYGDADGSGVVDFDDLNDFFIPALFQDDFALDADNSGLVDFDDLNDFFIPALFAQRPTLG